MTTGMAHNAGRFALKLAVIAGIVSVALVSWTAMASAQPPGAAAQSEFVPVSDLPASEQLPAATLLIAAYAFVWVVLLIYLWSIWGRLGRVSVELSALERRLVKSGDVRR